MKNLLAALFCLLSIVANAQTEEQNAVTEKKGTVSGKVRNEKDEVMPNAKVFVYNGNDIVGSGSTDITGSFQTNRILTGTYKVRTIAGGYKSMIVTGVPVLLNGDTEINLKIFPQSDRDDTTAIYASYNVVSVEKPKPVKKTAQLKKTLKK